MSAKVSVIIPTFNRVAVLPEAVESVLAQTHGDIEVVIVDDGSSDATPELVAGIAARDSRVRYERQSNAGAAAARNTGLAASSGDLVAFLDSDDSWAPWHLSLMVAGLARYPEAGLIWSDTDFIDGSGRVVASRAIDQLLGNWHHFPPDRLFSTATRLGDLGVEIPAADRDRRLFVGDVSTEMIAGNLVLTSSTVMRRTRVDEAGRFDTTFAVGEDYDFFMRACRAGPVAFADIAGVRYRVGTPDKLAKPAASLAMAIAYLRVLDATSKAGGSGVGAPPRMVAHARAHAYGWIGEQRLLAGSHGAARKDLARSLRIQPAQPGVLFLVVLSFLPGAIIRRLAGLRRTARSRLGWGA